MWLIKLYSSHQWKSKGTIIKDPSEALSPVGLKHSTIHLQLQDNDSILRYNEL